MDFVEQRLYRAELSIFLAARRQTIEKQLLALT